MAYNAILGHPLIKQAHMIMVVYYLTVKFFTAMRTCFVKADRSVARKCHLKSLKIIKSCEWKEDDMKITSLQDISLEQLDCREDTFKP